MYAPDEEMMSNPKVIAYSEMLRILDDLSEIIHKAQKKIKEQQKQIQERRLNNASRID